jgi:GNAT superfamily N-acetyltransferase
VTVDIASAAQEAGTVRKVAEDELPQVAEVLAQAFYDDPQFAWIVPDDARRLDILERAFLLFLRRIWFAQDESYTTAGVVGAAVWERPGEWKTPIGKQLTMAPAMARIFGRFLPRIMRAIATVESNHPSEPHYYLPFVGVVPEWQGRGLGAALMRPILERCDSESLPAYLEASTPRNRALYERHGFVVTEEFKLGKGGPPLWRMWRAPGARTT